METEATDPMRALRGHTAKGQLLCQQGKVREAINELVLARELLPGVADPFARTNLLHTLSYAQLLAGEYDAALDTTRISINEGREAGLRFAVNFGLVRLAAAQIGTRRFRQAEITIGEIRRGSGDSPTFVDDQIELLRVRLAIAAGNLRKAETLLEGQLGQARRIALRGEIRALHALVVAAAGRDAEAERILEGDEESFTFAESRALRAVARAVIAIKREGPKEDAISLMDNLLTAGDADAVVTGYRACPALADVTADSGLRAAISELLERSRDHDIARAAGLRLARELRPRERLSTREQEVLELIIQGRSNQDIAKTLFISQSTAKVHVRHIFEKLGVHSRAEAVRLVSLETPN